MTHTPDPPDPNATMTEPEPVRRRLAAEYRNAAADPDRPEAERRRFAELAERWAATLPGEGRREGPKE